MKDCQSFWKTIFLILKGTLKFRDNVGWLRFFLWSYLNKIITFVGWVFLNTRIPKDDYRFNGNCLLVDLSVFVQTWNRYSSGQRSLFPKQYHRYLRCTIVLLYFDHFWQISPYMVPVNQLGKSFASWWVIQVPYFNKICNFSPYFYSEVLGCLAVLRGSHFRLKTFGKGNVVEKLWLLLLQANSFFIQVNHKARCSFPHITMKNVYMLWRLLCKPYFQILFLIWLP